ncbi:DUF433 domain-containing protein [Endozoicomonas euniceicola]|uniref:DUF433 domain-containing protein n=1 Tax=Endozoicomonas euniceicola TaxID=1234143 RepID=A0ABY6H0F9_9GAMM|nr:DUF433 domain-containing protein [Endozoicomonas euniceicola]UYM18532.1 DUF433 domain-containing protein [Endozoicomonas euniceicola]
MRKEDYSQYIEIDPDKRFGKPCIKGTRITVTDILEMLASGMTQIEILEEHTNLQSTHVKAALLYAANQLPGAA